MRVGDSVKYSARFLRSISCYTGPLCFARGVITDIDRSESIRLATIDWDTPDIPKKVYTSNLVEADSVELA